MPSRPSRLSPTRQTERQRKRAIDQRRGSAWRRGYDRAWQELRKQKLDADPSCEMCKPRLVEATVVDHIVSIEERPDLRLEWSNIRSLCKSHHDQRTAADHGFNRGKRTVRRMGCGPDGMPVDPGHGWNR